jgi:hypothetical protein
MSLSLRKVEEKGAAKGGKKHGIYAYLASGKLPSGRAWKREQAVIGRLREDLIDQYGGEKIRPAVLALIESAIEGLTIQRLASLYVRKAGILRRDSLKRGDLQLHSVLSGQFISYANLVRLNLEAASRLAAQKEPGADAPTLADIIAEADSEEAAEASGGFEDGRSAAGQGDGKGLESGDSKSDGQVEEVND